MLDVRIHFFLLFGFSAILIGDCYFVTLSDNAPVVLGANVTFKAELFNNYRVRPAGTFRFRWRDNAIPQHTSESEGSDTVAYWNVSYPAHLYPPGPYEVEVIVDKSTLFYWPVSSRRIIFNITGLLNGEMTLAQSNLTVETQYVSSVGQVTHQVDLTEPDAAFLEDKATSILTYWFVDCVYYGMTPGYVFNFNYTKPEKVHNVEALVVASYEPPTTTTTSTTTTTTTTTTTSTTTTTTTTTTTPVPHPNTTTTAQTTTPTPPTTTSAATTSIKVATTTTPPATHSTGNVSNEINSNDINIAMQMFPVQNTTATPVLAPRVNVTNTTDQKYFVPYVCLNSSIIPPDPNKTYGYFQKKLVVKAPVENISVSDINWLKHGDMLDLQVYCNGSSDFEHCHLIYAAPYNVTGNETCELLKSKVCHFQVLHYFREPSQYTVVIIIKNQVSKVFTKVGINVYEVTKHAQLSVIVVPVSCSLIAVILIVFGVAYYVESKKRYIVEVADFDFGQGSDMEYKTFKERLKESMSNAINRSDFSEQGSSWSPSRKYGPMN